MSIEQAKLFIEKMKTDEVFRNRFMAIEDTDERMKNISLDGFDCTKDDVQALYTVLEFAASEYEQIDTQGGGGCNTNKCLCSIERLIL